MQHTQVNYRSFVYGALLVVGLFFPAKAAFSQGISERGKPDPILTNNPAGACDPELGQPDLVNGADVDGNPVASADLASAPIPLQGQIEVPLNTARGKAYVAVDGSKLGPLLNPKSPCH